MAAAGSAGVEFDPVHTLVAYGGTPVAQAGAPLPHDAQGVKKHMGGERIEIEIRIGNGPGTARAIGIDLGPGYIKENSVTS